MDTDTWTSCELGHTHWGLAGAAGLLLTSHSPQGDRVVLLQHRAEETHHGDTWGIPGGALGIHEGPVRGALREAREELEALESVRIFVDRVVTDDHGGWAYHTVISEAQWFEPRGTGWETGEEGFRWVPLPEVERLPLHPGFEASWPTLRFELS